eukprot:TRINITY_DN3427_c0_g1_i3.p1 TRINITY_DN3427_c0_g1~~TRINITY_DN3427_c0_g1_i3.p1  ORF type:complete len:410 (+),score=72.62 TRINITY_DN3427_c0_g1_i3:62-1291(+)
MLGLGYIPLLFVAACAFYAFYAWYSNRTREVPETQEELFARIDAEDDQKQLAAGVAARAAKAVYQTEAIPIDLPFPAGGSDAPDVVGWCVDVLQDLRSGWLDDPHWGIRSSKTDAARRRFEEDEETMLLRYDEDTWGPWSGYQPDGIDRVGVARFGGGPFDPSGKKDRPFVRTYAYSAGGETAAHFVQDGVEFGPGWRHQGYTSVSAGVNASGEVDEHVRFALGEVVHNVRARCASVSYAVAVNRVDVEQFFSQRGQMTDGLGLRGPLNAEDNLNDVYVGPHRAGEQWSDWRAPSAVDPVFRRECGEPEDVWPKEKNTSKRSLALGGVKISVKLVSTSLCLEVAWAVDEYHAHLGAGRQLTTPALVTPERRAEALARHLAPFLTQHIADRALRGGLPSGPPPSAPPLGE